MKISFIEPGFCRVPELAQIEMKLSELFLFRQEISTVVESSEQREVRINFIDELFLHIGDLSSSSISSSEA